MTHSKKIDRILKNYFFPYEDEPDLTHECLCTLFRRTEYYRQWDKFWHTVNAEKKVYLSRYFEYYAHEWERALLRLLLVEEFKEYLDNGCEFK